MISWKRQHPGPDLRPAGTGPVLIAFLLACGAFIPATTSPEARAGSSWLSTAYNDFNGTGMELDNCTMNVSGAGCAIQLEQSGNWQNRRPPNSPKADFSFSLAPVGNQDKLVFYGGIDDLGGGMGRYLNETWVYDIPNNTWTQMFPPINPGSRFDSAMAPVAGQDRVLLFSGNGNPVADTWIYDLGDDQWYRLSPKASPGWRIGHALAPVPGSTEIVLFGGSGDLLLYCDTWIFNTTDGQWTEMVSPEHPSERHHHAMAPVWDSKMIVLFGGQGDHEKLNDTWAFDAGQRRWHQRAPAAIPRPRDSHGMAALPGTDRIFLFGGWLEYPYGTAHDSWLYDYESDLWEQRYPSLYPTGVSYYALAAPKENGKVICYGTGETWEFDFSLFQHKGVYSSPHHDTGGDSHYLSICWTVNAPENTSVEFRIRTARSVNALASATFVGPDGTDATCYRDYSAVWWGHTGHRWVQYQAVLRTMDLAATPVLKGVGIGYNRLPQMPELLEPPNGSWTNTGSPLFEWTFNDSDSPSQGGFELQLSARTNFSSPNFTSGVVDSDRTRFILNDTIEDGTWYWRVRTRDSEGEWGPYSRHSILNIDTSPPADFRVEAYPAAWTRDPCMISFDTRDNLSGIDGYEVWIDKDNYGYQDSPFTIPHLPDGVHRILVRACDMAGNSVEAGTRVYLDKGAPAPFTPSASISSWTDTIPKIYFNTSDFASGIDHYEASIDDGAFSRRASPLELPDLPDGEHIITVRAFDRVGNSRDGSVSIFLDRGRPIDLLLSVDASGWTNKDPLLSFEAYDPISGIDHYDVMARGGIFLTRTSPLALANLEDGTSLITVRAFDRAGNYAEGNLSVKVDRTPPDAFAPSAEPSSWTRTDPVIKFNSFDRTSGVDHFGLRIDDGEFTTSSSPCTLFRVPDGKHIVTVRAFDRAGNFRDGNASVFIDTSSPSNISVNLAGGKRTTTTTAVTLAMDATDALSGLDSMCFSNDGASYSPWEPFNASKAWTLSGGAGSKTVSVKVRDRAGNEAGASATIEYAPVPAGGGPPLPAAAIAILGAALLAGAYILRRRVKAPDQKT